MGAFFYDLHLHSCLSPCGSDDNTPHDLAAMAAVAGLNLVALTDHNSCKNAPAFLAATEMFSKELGLPMLALAGMEMTTAEEVHMVCLFPELSAAMDFDKEVEHHLLPFPNKKEVFGNQRILDAEDNLLGEYETLLVSACDLSLWEGKKLCERFGGLAFPAHIDRKSYSVLSNLGFFPFDCGFTAFELADYSLLPEMEAGTPELIPLTALSSSDAHYLEDVGKCGLAMHLPELSTEAVFAKLRGEI